jgi:hypothetical protein
MVFVCPQTKHFFRRFACSLKRNIVRRAIFAGVYLVQFTAYEKITAGAPMITKEQRIEAMKGVLASLFACRASCQARPI